LSNFTFSGTSAEELIEEIITTLAENSSSVEGEKDLPCTSGSKRPIGNKNLVDKAEPVLEPKRTRKILQSEGLLFSVAKNIWFLYFYILHFNYVFHVGVDLGGPYLLWDSLRRKPTTAKAYIRLFTHKEGGSRMKQFYYKFASNLAKFSLAPECDPNIRENIVGKEKLSPMYEKCLVLSFYLKSEVYPGFLNDIDLSVGMPQSVKADTLLFLYREVKNRSEAKNVMILDKARSLQFTKTCRVEIAINLTRV